MSVTEKDLEDMPDDTYFVAKTDKKEPAPEKKRTKSRSSRGYERPDDYYHDSRRPGRTPFRRFEENKLTPSRLKQMIREAMFGKQLNEQIKDAITGKTIAPNAFSQKQIDNGIPDMVRRGELVAYIGNNGQVLAVVPSELETIKNARAARSKGQEGDYSAIVEQMYELLMKYNCP